MPASADDVTCHATVTTGVILKNYLTIGKYQMLRNSMDNQPYFFA